MMRMGAVQDIQFYHADGHKDVVLEWEALFEHAELGLQAAVCYATAPGMEILSKAARRIAYGDGFFVTSPSRIIASLIAGIRFVFTLCHKTGRTSVEEVLVR